MQMLKKNIGLQTALVLVPVKGCLENSDFFWIVLLKHPTNLIIELLI